MSSIMDPSHEAFPRDDRLYRIYWAGELVMPKAGDATHRVRSWLKEVDDFGREVSDSPIRQVTESVGAIPKLVIGSHWRNGRRARPKHVAARASAVLDIVAPDTWTIVRAGDYLPNDPARPGPSHTWINPSDMRLSFSTETGQRVHGHNARLVVARTVSGQEVIIPSYELFRALYGGTTDLANALLRGVWDRAEGRFIAGSEAYDGEEGAYWSLGLAPGVPHSAVPYLCWMHFYPQARRAANRIYPATVQQGQTWHVPWIAAEPPIVGQTFRMRAQTQYLRSRGALLVTQIEGMNCPVKVADLAYTIAVRNVPIYTPPVPGGGTSEPGEPIEKKKPNSVSKPGNSRPTMRFFQLPSAVVRFDGLPNPRRSARSERKIPITERKPSTEPPTPRQVSVGVPGTGGAPSRAQYTPEEEIVIEDRFQAIMDLVDELLADGKIDEALPHAIVRPAPNEAPMYCEFPRETADGKPCAWATVRAPEVRQRLALVLQLSVQNRLIYWIETETTTRGYSSLAVETASGESLDEGMLDALLDLCAEKKGVWPKRLPFGAGSIFATRAIHTRIGDHYTANVMLLAFARLERAKRSPGESPAEAGNGAVTDGQ